MLTGSPKPFRQLVRVAPQQPLHPQPAGGGGVQQLVANYYQPITKMFNKNDR